MGCHDNGLLARLMPPPRGAFFPDVRDGAAGERLKWGAQMGKKLKC